MQDILSVGLKPQILGMSGIRDLTIRDLVELEKKAQFPLDFLINKPKLVQKTFEDDKGLIGSIIVTGTCEISAIFDNDRPKAIVRVLQALPEILQRELIPKGYRDAHTFIANNPGYAQILVDHLGFEDVVGRPLVWRVKG